MKLGTITQIDKDGTVWISDGFGVFKHRYFPEATDGMQVVFNIVSDEDGTPYAEGALILASEASLTILKKLNQIQAGVNTLLDFEIPETYFGDSA